MYALKANNKQTGITIACYLFLIFMNLIENYYNERKQRKSYLLKNKFQINSLLFKKLLENLSEKSKVKSLFLKINKNK